jgi:hypothetical protein
VQSPSSGSALLVLAKVTVMNVIKIGYINHPDVFSLIILTTVTLASMNNALPDDGDCTETCQSYFNVNFNVNFKIVFKTVHLCISWWMKNFDNEEHMLLYTWFRLYFITLFN